MNTIDLLGIALLTLTVALISFSVCWAGYSAVYGYSEDHIYCWFACWLVLVCFLIFRRQIFQWCLNECNKSLSSFTKDDFSKFLIRINWANSVIQLLLFVVSMYGVVKDERNETYKWCVIVLDVASKVTVFNINICTVVLRLPFHMYYCEWLQFGLSLLLVGFHFFSHLVKCTLIENVRLNLVSYVKSNLMSYVQSNKFSIANTTLTIVWNNWESLNDFAKWVRGSGMTLKEIEQMMSTIEITLSKQLDIFKKANVHTRLFVSMLAFMSCVVIVAIHDASRAVIAICVIKLVLFLFSQWYDSILSKRVIPCVEEGLAMVRNVDMWYTCGKVGLKTASFLKKKLEESEVGKKLSEVGKKLFEVGKKLFVW